VRAKVADLGQERNVEERECRLRREPRRKKWNRERGAYSQTKQGRAEIEAKRGNGRNKCSNVYVNSTACH